MNKERTNKAGTRKLLIGLFGSLAMLFVLSTWLDAPARALVLRDPLIRTDAALVFGGDPGFERTRQAAQLFQDGLTGVLILCGGEEGPGDSARSLMEQALRHGVPADKILLEERSTSTRESVVFSRPILERHEIDSLTLITAPYHQRRAFLAARRALGDEIRLVNCPARPSFWSPEGWWQQWRTIRIVLTEYGKLLYYLVRGWI